MLDVSFWEWIGYLGSVLVAVSLTMKSMLRLRWFNFIGALIFTIYGLAIDALPVALVNGFITIIDIYFLFKIYTKKDYFTHIRVASDDVYVKTFLDFYKEPIHAEFPEFDAALMQGKKVFLIHRNMNVASIVVGDIRDEVFYIELDYAIPQYQDFKTGAYFYNKKKSSLHKEGISQLSVTPYSKALKNYYTRLKFAPSGNVYIRDI